MARTGRHLTVLAALLLLATVLLPAGAQARHSCTGPELQGPAGVVAGQYGGFASPLNYEVEMERGDQLIAALAMVGGDPPRVPAFVEDLPTIPGPATIVEDTVEAVDLPRPVLGAHLEVHDSQGCHNFYEYGRAVHFTAPSDGTYVLQVHGAFGAAFTFGYILPSN